MLHDPLGLLGSILSFAGGAVLSYDALTIRSRTRSSAGTERISEALTELNRPDVLTDSAGKPLDSKTAIDLWLAANSLRCTRFGFTLMTAGFLADAVSRVIS